MTNCIDVCKNPILFPQKENLGRFLNCVIIMQVIRALFSNCSKLMRIL